MGAFCAEFVLRNSEPCNTLRLRGTFEKVTIDEADLRNILLIRLSSLGDVVLTSPAIRAVRNHFPNARISMLVASQSADLLAENPHLDEVLRFDRHAKDKDTAEMIRLVRALRERQFDLTIDFQRKFRTSLLGYLSGAKYRVGYHQPKRACYVLCVFPIRPDTPSIVTLPCCMPWESRRKIERWSCFSRNAIGNMHGTPWKNKALMETGQR